jgi:IS30 family transposase
MLTTETRKGAMTQKKLNLQDVRQAKALRKRGLTLAQIGAKFGCSWITVYRALPPSAGRGRHRNRIEAWDPGPGRLRLDEREEIGRGLVAAESLSAIAARLGRSASTISREVGANGGRRDYRAWRAHLRAHARARRPKVAKLDDPDLCRLVSEWLTQCYSPEQITLRLHFEFPDDPMKWVSHETIYQSLFVQGRGELRRELTRCLRSGRTRRRPRSRAGHGSKISDMVMISERPAEVADRAVPGHWEGDLVIGANNRSAVGTLVERTSRYMLLLHLPNGHGAEEVDAAMRRAIAKLPGELFRTITWDQGREMARHGAFTVDTGIQIYFCDPHSPWQRPTNENTNGLLRQYLPKGTDLSKYSEADLDAIARNMNNRPRKNLGAMKPVERLSEILAHTG